MDYKGIFIDKKKTEQLSTSIEEIEAHTNKVRRNLISCNLNNCPCCAVAPGEFKKHEARERQFYVIVEQVIQVIIGLLIRWKCPGCGKTFTEYPEFALPYKRYTVPTILKFSAFYTEDEKISYREVNKKMPVAYPDSEMQMGHTSIHRWITDIGNSTEIIRNSVDMILQADPSSSICRDIASFFIPPKKYRTPERLKLLFHCRQFLKIQKLFSHIFGVKIFPNFDTKHIFQ